MALRAGAASLRAIAVRHGANGARRFAVAAAAADSSSAVASGWRLSAAVCLERYPRVLTPPTPEERAYAAFAKDMQTEKSAVSLEEYLALSATVADASAKKGGSKKDKAATATMPSSVPDEALTGPKEELLLPGVQSEADIANDRTSLNRRLTEKLILLVRDAAGVWQLPSAPYASESDPGLRQTAERALQLATEGSPDAYFFGNHPSCCMTLPAESEDNGDKVFIFRSMLVGGGADVSNTYQDHVWVAADELGEYLQGPRLEAIQRFLA